MVHSLLAAILFLLFISPSFAEPKDSSDISMSADSMSRDFEKKSIILEGSVQLIINKNHISCDKATIDLTNETITAEGSVELSNSKTTSRGEKIIYNYNTERGTIFNGYVQSGTVVFEGETIEKTGTNEYTATKATYTACTTCPPAWSFSGEKIEAEIGGYALIKYPILRISSIPVFFLPQLIVPLKNSRQSGLLVPTIDFSSVSGTGISQSYFWAISRSKDITATLKHYEKKGLKGLLEYRYVLTEKSRGYFKGAYIYDKTFKEDTSSKTTKSLDRSFFTYSHRYELPSNFTQRVNINYISDLKYPRDFADEISGHGDSALENTISLTHNDENYHKSIEASFYRNLLKTNAKADNKDSVHRFPEIQVGISEQEIGESGFFFNLDLNYVHFSRNGFGYDDITGTGTSRRVKANRDGSYDPTVDLLRTGHRLVAQPTISRPFQIARMIDVLPKITYNESQYRFNAQANNDIYSQIAVRKFFTTDLALKTQFSKVFGKTTGPENSYKHIFEPQITLSRIGWVKRPNHIFFGNFEDQPYSRQTEHLSNSDFFGSSKIQFDYKDRIFDKKIVNFELNNYLVRKNWNGDLAHYEHFARFKVEQSYDFTEQRRENPEPWSAINAYLDLRLKNFETISNVEYYPYASVSNLYSRMRLKSNIGNYFEVTYSQNFSIDEDNNYSFDERTEAIGTGVGFNSKYINLVGSLNYNAVSFDLSSWSYTAHIKPPGNCWGIRVDHRKTLGADTVFKISFNFDFGGEKDFL